MIEQRLQDLDVAFPAAPDVTDAVLRSIRQEPVRAHWWLRAATAAAVVLVVVLAIPTVRSEVAAWLGIDSLVITTTEPLDAAVESRVDVGATETSIEQASAIAGFAPAVSPVLGEPDRVLAANDLVWMFYGVTDELPETELAGVGAIVTQWSADSGVMDVKSLSVDGPDAELLMINGDPAFWLGTDHTVEITGLDGVVLDRRPAGPTLIWLDGERVLRLEIQLDRDSAVRIAQSFTPNR